MIKKYFVLNRNPLLLLVVCLLLFFCLIVSVNASEEFFENCGDISDWVVTGAWASNGSICAAPANTEFENMTSQIIDLSGGSIAYANLSFDTTHSALDVANDDFWVSVNSSINGWTVIHDSVDVGSFEYNLSAYITLDAGVHIRATCENDVKEECQWDNINVTSYEVEVTDNLPNVSLISPDNATSSSNTSYNFTCQVSDDNLVVNTTLYVWNSTELFNTSVNTTNFTVATNVTFEVPIPIADYYEWNCLVYDNASTPQSNWSTNNNTLTKLNNISSCDVNITVPGTYYVTQNLSYGSGDCITINTGNVTIECQDYWLDATSIPSVFAFINNGTVDGSRPTRKNITLNDCNIHDWNYGIYFRNVEDVIINNTLSENSLRGIVFYDSKNVVLENVTTVNNTNFNIHMLTNDTDYCSYNFTDVIGEDSNPIVFFNETVTIEDWDNNVSSIIMCGANNSVIDNLTMEHSSVQNDNIRIVMSGNVTIMNSNISNLYIGTFFGYGENNSITNTNFTNNYLGVEFYRSGNNTLKDSIISNSSRASGTPAGVYFATSSDYLTTPNLVYNNLFNKMLLSNQVQESLVREQTLEEIIGLTVVVMITQTLVLTVTLMVSVTLLITYQQVQVAVGVAVVIILITCL
jgi:parallel beta-helix repeat protein